MEAIDWNVVVLGYWNLSILNPGRIGTKVFGLDSGVPLEVLVQLDSQSTFQVKHDNVIVVPAHNQLVLQTVEHSSENLAKAATFARNAIESLPETPLIACGINFRYKFEELPAAMSGLVRCGTEGILSDLDHDIVHRRRGESVRHNNGMLRINIDLVNEDEGANTIVFNFDLQNPNAQSAADWLSQDIEVLHSITNRILEKLDD